MNVFHENRYLLLGLVFMLATLFGWTWTADTYHQRLAVVQSGTRSFDVTLQEVIRYRGLFPDRSFDPWLGPDDASKARKELARYQSLLGATLACGFLAVFSLGMHIDRLRSELAV